MTEALGMGKNSYTNWKKDLTDKRKGAKHVNNYKYSQEDREKALLALMLNPDMNPYELQAKYLDEHNTYLGSARWLYRLLEETKLNKRRDGSSSSKSKDSVERRALVATAPNQVFVWDITYLYKANPMGQYYYLYAVMDLYSRKMIHWEVHETQSAELAAQFIEKAFNKAGFKKPSCKAVELNGTNRDIFGNVLVLHSDNGAPMRGSTMVAKCTELGIECTYNRARHSNDNAHMEASFKLLKHGHEVAIPEAFNTLKHARTWVDQYYHWYNNKHRHSGICYITPQQCYEGKGPGIMKKRNDIIDIYYQQHKDQGLLRDNITSTGKMRRCLWQMPAKVEVMPFYTKRARVKKVIRAKKLDIETPACNDSNLEVV